MTPVAHRIEKMFFSGDRSDETVALHTALHSDAKCFDMSAVWEGVTVLRHKLQNSLEAKACPPEELHDIADIIDADTAFLPAPITWIEGAEGEGRPVAWIIETDPDGLTAAVHGAGVSSNGQAVFRPGLAVMYLRGSEHFGKIPLLPPTGEIPTPNAVQGAIIFQTYCALAMINSPKIIGRRENEPHRGLAKTARALGYTLRPWTEIVLEIDPEEGRTGGAHRFTAGKALHFCRSHIRIRRGKLEVVKAHWRGDPALGIVQSKYKVVQ